MKRTGLLVLVAAFSVLALSCSTEKVDPEVDYGFPFTIQTRGEASSAVEVIRLLLVTDPEEDQFEGTDFFSCSVSLVPGKTTPLLSDERVLLMAYFPDLNSLSIGQEMVPVRLTFGYIMSNNIGHVVHKISSGKIIYRGMKEDKALIEFQDVLFVTIPYTYSPNGEHLLTGTMECPVYNRISEVDQ